MKPIFWCLGASAWLLSGCNNANRAVSEPVPQKIAEAAPSSEAAPAVAETSEPVAVPITRATPSADGKAVAREAVPKSSKGVAAFDAKQFRVARTLELPYYNDQIFGFAFSPDGAMVAGVGRGYVISKTEGGERGVVFLFDVKSGALLQRLASEALPERNGLGPSFDRVVWSPDGKFVAAWNADSGGIGGALCVWDVGSGQRTAVFRNARLSVTNAAWMNDGSLLVARNDQSNGLTINGQLMICDGQTGKISSVFDLGQQTVTSIHVPQQGPPQLLILKAVGEQRTDREPDIQSSVRSFEAGTLSQPLLQFPIRQALLGAAWSAEGRIAVAGIEQAQNDGSPTAALYAVGDLRTGNVVWQSKKKPIDFSLEPFLSPDARQLWARTPNYRSELAFDMANGRSSTLPERQIPLFSPDGKRFVRLLNSGKRAPNGQLLPDGQKPNLKVAEIWER